LPFLPIKIDGSGGPGAVQKRADYTIQGMGL
jgi:hypothetical protein